MSDTATIDRYAILSNGYSVRLDLHIALRRQIEEIIPALQPEVDYTVEALCGPEQWRSLSTAEHLIAGRVVAHLVATNQLPLGLSGCKHRVPRRYRLK